MTDIVLSLFSSKATGWDNIPIRLIKDSITIISAPYPICLILQFLHVPSPVLSILNVIIDLSPF